MLHEVTDVMRDKQINIRLTETEAAAVAKLAERYETNTAGLVRKLLKDAAGTLDTTWRWNHVKDEALRLAEQAQIPSLRMWFDDNWRTIYLDDGIDGEVLSGGHGAYFALATWPGSKLTPPLEARRRYPEHANHRLQVGNEPPAFETPKTAKKK